MSDPTAPDPFCPVHGPARASDHAAAGCTCRPVPPSPPPPEAPEPTRCAECDKGTPSYGSPPVHDVTLSNGQKMLGIRCVKEWRPVDPAPQLPEALAQMPPGLLILIDKADDWLEASKLANRDFATAQHGIAADLKRKAFVEFIHASVRENPKTLQTGLSLLRSLARRLQEAERHGYRLAMEVLQSELFRNPEDDIRAAVRYMTRNGPRA